MSAAFEQMTGEEQEKFLRGLLRKSQKVTKADTALPVAKELGDYVPPETKQEYHPLEFLHSAELLAFFDPNILAGRIKLHPWQVEENIRISNPRFTKHNALQYELVAANGSGKDAYIICPICIFKLLCRIRSRTVVTSSSNTQLKLQTENYVVTLAELVNKNLAERGICEKAIDIRRTPVTHLTSELTGSELVLFTTDETGRAEGWHPFPDKPDGEVTLIINEAKTVPDFIFDAFGRCTYTTMIEVSSPGQTNGRFYHNFLKARSYPEPYKDGERYSRRVTSYDCAHISKQKIDRDKEDWGEGSFLFRSRHLAEFTSLGESVVITTEMLDKCLAKNYSKDEALRTPKYNIGIGLHAGVDLGGLASRGGDENVIMVFNDNVFVDKICFFCSDADEMVGVLIGHFARFGLNQSSVINIDDGNIGAAIISNLRNKGWSINKICNQSKAINPNLYLNRGAELWFHFKRLVEEGIVVLPKRDDDERLYTQLTTRRYDASGHQGKIFLEDKKMAKKGGGASPDRADACILAFAGYTIHDFIQKESVTRREAQAIFRIKEISKDQTQRRTFVYNQPPRAGEALDLSVQKNYTSFNPGRILREYYGK